MRLLLGTLALPQFPGRCYVAVRCPATKGLDDVRVRGHLARIVD